MTEYGPTLPVSKWVYDTKYLEGETFKEGMTRVANALKDSSEHFEYTRNVLYDQRFLPGGRILSSVGATRVTTPLNCYVMDTIPDSMEGIMRVAAEAAETMRMGGGVGYDFSTLRPRGAIIRSLDSSSSGPLAFMDVFNSLCGCISSAGHRRGAQMGVLRVDHPDIEQFIEAKCNTSRLTNFNISVGITDEFMQAVFTDSLFDLRFEGTVYKTVKAKALWDKIMRATWDWAEPGVLFIDRINRKNNLWYCERIAATNPCGEQPLPPYGACLLGSWNLTKYIGTDFVRGRGFNFDLLREDIPNVVRAMDNVLSVGTYPLERQELEALRKRRMGLGITGLANTCDVLGKRYGTPEMLELTEDIMKFIRDHTYLASIELAKEKGSFPYFNKEKYLESEFCRSLPEGIRSLLSTHGIRNSHLLSVAPTGTISLGADNISSGIEPPYKHSYVRDITTFEGTRTETVTDWAYRVHGVKGKTADTVPVSDHVKVLNLCSKYVDSACSKTCNVGPEVTWEEFKGIYEEAYKGGASGCTTFRLNGKRFGMMRGEEDDTKNELSEDELIVEGSACYIDQETGIKTCE